MAFASLERRREYDREYRRTHPKPKHPVRRGPYRPRPEGLVCAPNPDADLAGYRRLAYEALLGGFRELAEHIRQGCQDESRVDQLIQWILECEWVQIFTKTEPGKLRRIIDRVLDGELALGKFSRQALQMGLEERRCHHRNGWQRRRLRQGK